MRWPRPEDGAPRTVIRFAWLPVRLSAVPVTVWLEKYISCQRYFEEWGWTDWRTMPYDEEVLNPKAPDGL